MNRKNRMARLARGKRSIPYMLLGLAVLIVLFLFLRHRREGFNNPPTEYYVNASKPIPSYSIDPSTFPQGQLLSGISFKVWNGSSWGPELNHTNLPRTYDMGGTSIQFKSGSIVLKKPNLTTPLIGGQMKLPVPVSSLTQPLIIQNIGAATLGTMKAQGDPTKNNANVIIGLTFTEGSASAPALGGMSFAGMSM